MASQNLSAQNYLDLKSKYVQDLSNTFSQYANLMYGEQGGGYITIHNNTNENGTRYNFSIKMNNDGSDGIKRAKILAFNYLLLKNGKHKFDFIIMDNKVFYGADFGALCRFIKFIFNQDDNNQYIFTINQSEYDAIKKEFNNDVLFDSIVEQNIKIRLGSNEKERLLGQIIDLQ